jgi:SAM-dependent methyltransferase
VSLEVLPNSAENARARQEIRRRGLHFITPWLAKVVYKTGLASGVNVGLHKKSWDVLKTLEFLEQHVDKSSPVLDLGAYGSEVLCSLNKLGFSNLTGIDFNPELLHMPFRESIKYVTGDFTKTSFPNQSFAAISAISVIEHGFSAPKLLAEMGRLLKPGGYFVGSTDYWPEKIDTRGVFAYGLDWTIFSKSDLLQFIREAANYGLQPVGPLNVQASKTTVRWFRRNYTFAWFAFQKTPSNGSQPSGRKDVQL